MTHTAADALPTKAAKATQTKQAKWERIAHNPEAERLMREIVILEEEEWHAKIHRGAVRGWQCREPLCDIGSDRAHADLIVVARQHLAWEYRSIFRARFGVGYWYMKRLKRQVWESYTRQQQRVEDLERWSDDHRHALREWLADWTGPAPDMTHVLDDAALWLADVADETIAATVAQADTACDALAADLADMRATIYEVIKLYLHLEDRYRATLRSRVETQAWAAGMRGEVRVYDGSPR